MCQCSSDNITITLNHHWANATQGHQTQLANLSAGCTSGPDAIWNISDPSPKTWPSTWHVEAEHPHLGGLWGNFVGMLIKVFIKWFTKNLLGDVEGSHRDSPCSGNLFFASMIQKFVMALWTLHSNGAAIPIWFGLKLAPPKWQSPIELFQIQKLYQREPPTDSRPLPCLYA